MRTILASNGTIFPSPVGMACSFNPDLIHKAAQHTATESNSLGIPHIFAPVLDLALEQRFGRVEESRCSRPLSLPCSSY
jgi:beta-glucosidase